MLASLAGDESCYRQLLKEAADRLRAYFTRRLPGGASPAEDLVQDALLAVHTRRHTYDTDRPFTPWLHAIARYKLLDHLRQRPRGQSVALDDVEHLLVAPDSDGDLARYDIDRLLASMPKRTARLIRAVKIEGRSIAEASREAGLSESAAKVSMHRALKSLSEALRKGPRP